MPKKTTTSEAYSLTNPGSLEGFVVATSAVRGSIDVTTLQGCFLRFQALAADCDISWVDQVATPAADPVVGATAIGTRNVGQRIYVGVNEALVVPRPQTEKMWLVYQATGAGFLRGLEA